MLKVKTWIRKQDGSEVMGGSDIYLSARELSEHCRTAELREVLRELSGHVRGYRFPLSSLSTLRADEKETAKKIRTALAIGAI